MFRSIPRVGYVTSEVILADRDQFDFQEQVNSDIGLTPGKRESDGKYRQRHINEGAWKISIFLHRCVRYPGERHLSADECALISILCLRSVWIILAF
ncbi:MAG TPA: hypothetical protein DD473_18310 [Planctomycetaceae bacterium]|nr:hypothetical protein [Planctomycetaceae bacterium]